MDRYRIGTDAWEMDLPADWTQAGGGGGDETYFESGDGTKGIYIAACLVEEGAGRSSAEVAQAFRDAGLLSLRAMRGHAWELLADEAQTTDGTAVVVTDAVAAAQGYRIVCKVLAMLPLVVRAAFHDYLCEDLAASQSYFGPIVESLRVRWPVQ